MKNNEHGIMRKLFQKSIVIIALLAFWWIFPLYYPNLFFPSLRDVFHAMGGMVRSGEIFLHIGASLKRAAIGLLIAEALAIPLGIALGWFPAAENYLEPLLTALRNLSVLSILPLFVLILGIGENSKISVIVFACFFPQLINTIEGVKNVDLVLIRSARSMGISTAALFLKVVIPGSMSYIIAGFRLSASVSLLVLVGAEMLGAEYGVGYMIFHYEHAFLIPKMYCGILVMCIIGIIANALIGCMEKKLTAWQEKT